MSAINTLGWIASAAVTSITVCIQIISVRLSRKNLEQTIENRRASIRPLLVPSIPRATLDRKREEILRCMETHGACRHIWSKNGQWIIRPEISSHHNRAHFGTPFLAKFTVKNHGPGPAIAPKARVIWFSKDEREMAYVQLKTNQKRVESGADFIIEDAYFWSDQLPTRQAIIELSLEFSFEDTDGNLYAYSRAFQGHLHLSDGTEKTWDSSGLHLHAIPVREDLIMWSSAERRLPTDPLLTAELPFEPEQISSKGRTIFSRRCPSILTLQCAR